MRGPCYSASATWIGRSPTIAQAAPELCAAPAAAAEPADCWHLPLNWGQGRLLHSAVVHQARGDDATGRRPGRQRRQT